MTKKSFMMIALPIMAMSTAAMGVETVKVLDGATKSCKNASDVYHNRKGVYKAKALKSKTVGQNVELTVKLEFLACEKTETGYKFVHIDPYENTEFQTFTIREGIHSVQVLPINGHVKAYQDGVFKEIERKDLKFKAVQNHVIEIALDDLKTKPNIDLSVSKEVIYDSDEYQMMETVEYGAYRVHFNVVGQEATLK
jgi:hypothetical protein